MEYSDEYFISNCTHYKIIFFFSEAADSQYYE